MPVSARREDGLGGLLRRGFYFGINCSRVERRAWWTTENTTASAPEHTAEDESSSAWTVKRWMVAM